MKAKFILALTCFLIAAIAAFASDEKIWLEPAYSRWQDIPTQWPSCTQRDECWTEGWVICYNSNYIVEGGLFYPPGTVQLYGSNFSFCDFPLYRY